MAKGVERIMTDCYFIQLRTAFGMMFFFHTSNSSLEDSVPYFLPEEHFAECHSLRRAADW